MDAIQSVNSDMESVKVCDGREKHRFLQEYHLVRLRITVYVHVNVLLSVDCHFEASSLDFGRRHLVFLEPEVTIFGREGGAELVVL